MQAHPRGVKKSTARGFAARRAIPRSLAIAVGALALALSSLASVPPAPVAAADAPAGRLPACAYRDDLADLRSYDDWDRTVVDTTYRLPVAYAPPDLAPVARAGLAGSGGVRRFVIADLAELAHAARAAGIPLAAISGYRSYGSQAGTFAHWVGVLGYGRALLGSARAGHSEHQLGTTVDFASYPGGEPWYDSWYRSSTSAWLASNAWRYGFVLSYPPEKMAVTCYGYEPWHYRYVGRDTAAAVRESGLTLREYLWRQSSISVACDQTTCHRPARRS